MGKEHAKSLDLFRYGTWSDPILSTIYFRPAIVKGQNQLWSEYFLTLRPMRFDKFEIFWENFLDPDLADPTQVSKKWPKQDPSQKLLAQPITGFIHLKFHWKSYSVMTDPPHAWIHLFSFTGSQFPKDTIQGQVLSVKFWLVKTYLPSFRNFPGMIPHDKPW